MNVSRSLLLALTLCAALTATSGCNVPLIGVGEQPVDVPPGSIMTIDEPVTVWVKFTNTASGKPERHRIQAWPGWDISKPDYKPLGK